MTITDREVQRKPMPAFNGSPSNADMMRGQRITDIAPVYCRLRSLNGAVLWSSRIRCSRITCSMSHKNRLLDNTVVESFFAPRLRSSAVSDGVSCTAASEPSSSTSTARDSSIRRHLHNRHQSVDLGMRVPARKECHVRRVSGAVKVAQSSSKSPAAHCSADRWVDRRRARSQCSGPSR